MSTLFWELGVRPDDTKYEVAANNRSKQEYIAILVKSQYIGGDSFAKLVNPLGRLKRKQHVSDATRCCFGLATRTRRSSLNTSRDVKNGLKRRKVGWPDLRNERDEVDVAQFLVTSVSF